jgi:hypothetical protein
MEIDSAMCIYTPAHMLTDAVRSTQGTGSDLPKSQAIASLDMRLPILARTKDAFVFIGEASFLEYWGKFLPWGDMTFSLGRRHDHPHQT